MQDPVLSPVDDASNTDAVPVAPPPDGRVTPMMAQFLALKAAHADCLLFYRMGDFYELFLEDAEIASRELNIVLTKRGRHEDADIPMCGVPIDRSDDYLHRLIAAGHRVAICEQVEDPAEARKRGGKALVRREVVRLVTPGTLTEDRLLEPGRANLLLSLVRLWSGEGTQTFGFAAVDISTGEFGVGGCEAAALPALLARHEPAEIVLPEGLAEEPAVRAAMDGCKSAVTTVARALADGSLADRRLRDWFGVGTLDGFGAFSRAEIAAAACAVGYITRTQVGVRPQLRSPVRLQAAVVMEIDAATRANLELTRTLGGSRAGSVLSAVDATVTAAGGRLLAARLAGPLLDPEAIARRHDAVAFLMAGGVPRDAVRRHLKSLPDLARALSRLALDRGGPRDLAAVRDALAAAAAVAATLAPHAPLPDELRGAAAGPTAGLADLGRRLGAALAPDLPLQRRDGRFIAAGHDTVVDENRLLRDDARGVVAAVQARYAADTGLKALKVRHNTMLGFFVEVPQAVGESWLKPPHNAVFVHRQTMAGSMRFASAELADLDARIAAAGGGVLARELELFAELAAAVLGEATALRALADALACLDVAAAQAELAATRGWCRPRVDTSLAFLIAGGRHPVVEAALRGSGATFVPNDCDLSAPESSGPRQKPGGRIAVVTGPNMAGKSTFLRQNAILAILAQAGCFVPAASAHLGVVDRLFSRVGAADDLARGRSTFMVEMVEAAAILNQAGPRALVILDELGRGTATFDGLSIAWAAVEHLHGVNRSRGLFATHFHELTRLAAKLPRLVNLTMRVTDWQGEVVFLHEVVPGAADRSYGIQVAKLAGLPPRAVERARTLLAQLEADARAAPPATLDDLPLFAERAPTSPLRPEPALEALDALDPDELTPRAALEALYALKRVRADAPTRK